MKSRPHAVARAFAALTMVTTIAGTTGARQAFAHPVPFSFLDLRLQPDAIEGTLVVHIFDAGHDLDLNPPERLLDRAELARRSDALIRLLDGRLTVLADGRRLKASWGSVEPIPERQSIRLAIGYPVPVAPGTISVQAALFPYDPYHQTFLNVYESGALSQAILDQRHPGFEYYAGTARGVIAVFRTFLPTGIFHISLGIDHLLFLAGLMLLGGSARQLVLIVTAFTVAHTVSLSLAAVNVVNPPARIIDPAIALSIVYVGTDNLLLTVQRGGRDVRMWIAAAFGLIHGFGYARVLSELELSRRALVWTLGAFNVGLEIGQLLIVVALAIVLSALRARSEIAGRRLAFAGSIVVVAAGAFWFVQRVFFPTGI
jgi:hypothetical protein